MCLNQSKINLILLLIFLFSIAICQAQTAILLGKITSKGKPLEFADVYIQNIKKGATTDNTGQYQIVNIPAGTYVVTVSLIGFKAIKQTISLKSNDKKTINFSLTEQNADLEEVVITGTLKELRKSQSPVPVTVISSKLFEKNQSSNVLDALYQVNGINPQVNCNMCNTSDIGINGMQGPYTMVLIDGMPIVSSLSTVYGLSGIPNSIIKQVEIVKGPASSLYGSEAIGGVINIITKKARNVDSFFLDYNVSTWGELTGNTGFSAKISDKISTLFNLDGYYFNTQKDQDQDGFLDKTLQKRSSFFNKWNIKQRHDKTASLSLRYYNEDRHGGQADWNKNDRRFVEFNPFDDNPNSAGYNADVVLPNGYTVYNQKYAKGFRIPRFLNQTEIQNFINQVRKVNPNVVFAPDVKYQESVYTSRFEAVGKWQLPVEQNITLQTSYNQHDQNSAYGTELFMAHQKTVFGQIYWDKQIGNHSLLTGLSYRYTWFKDNTIASQNGLFPFVTKMPGIFIQDLWKTGDKTSLLLGYRLDYDQSESNNERHQNIVQSPRFAFKYTPNDNNTLRLSIGTGYRVVNIFSEDHRAISGQYKAEFGQDLKPEKSISGTFDYQGKLATEHIGLTCEIGTYYTHFFNKIYPTRNDQKRTLVYYNVNGDEYARNIGASLDVALNFSFPLKISAGVSYNKAQLFEHERDSDGSIIDNSVKPRDFEFSPRWMGVYSASYDITRRLTIDITGQWKGPMLLPTQGIMQIFDAKSNIIGTVADPRPERSPWFTKINMQSTYRMNKIQIYAGVKNIFNFVPKNLLVNTDDPFDDRASVFGGLIFDTEYNYTPQQGRTSYIGIRYSF